MYKVNYVSLRLNINHTYHALKNINNVKYDDSRKLMKQINFKVKNLGRTNLKKNNPLSNKIL